jgi:hypothetical protein
MVILANQQEMQRRTSGRFTLGVNESWNQVGWYPTQIGDQQE